MMLFSCIVGAGECGRMGESSLSRRATASKLCHSYRYRDCAVLYVLEIAGVFGYRLKGSHMYCLDICALLILCILYPANEDVLLHAD